MAAKVNLLEVGKNAIAEFGDDDMPTYAGALTYFIFLAIFPLALLALSIAAFFYTEPKQQQDLVSTILTALPNTGSGGQNIVKTAVENAVESRGPATIGGLIGLLFSSLGIFGTLSNALTRCWDVKAKSNIILDYLRNLASLLIAGVLFLTVNLASTVLTAVVNATGSLNLFGLQVPGWIYYIVTNIILSVLFLWVIFIIVYKFLPRTRVEFSDVIFGALLAAIALTVFKEVFVFYLQFSNNNATYGPFASLIGLLFYIFIAAQIILFGAEFCAEFSRAQDLADEKEIDSPVVAPDQDEEAKKAERRERLKSSSQRQQEADLKAVHRRIEVRHAVGQQRVDPAISGVAGRTLIQKEDEVLVKAAPVVGAAAVGAVAVGLLAKLTSKR